MSIIAKAKANYRLTVKQYLYCISSNLCVRITVLLFFGWPKENVLKIVFLSSKDFTIFVATVQHPR